MISFFEGDALIGVLKREISAEIEEFRPGLAKKGASTPVTVIEDVQRFEVNSAHVRRICEEFVADRLEAIELVYVLTAIELASCFEFSSEGLEEIVARLTDTSEGLVTREDVSAEFGSL